MGSWRFSTMSPISKASSPKISPVIGSMDETLANDTKKSVLIGVVVVFRWSQKEAIRDY